MGLPLGVDTSISGRTWKAIVNIPMDYLPAKVSRPNFSKIYNCNL